MCISCHEKKWLLCRTFLHIEVFEFRRFLRNIPSRIRSSLRRDNAAITSQRATGHLRSRLALAPPSRSAARRPKVSTRGDREARIRLAILMNESVTFTRSVRDDVVRASSEQHALAKQTPIATVYTISLLFLSTSKRSLSLPLPYRLSSARSRRSIKLSVSSSPARSKTVRFAFFPLNLNRDLARRCPSLFGVAINQYNFRI